MMTVRSGVHLKVPLCVAWICLSTGLSLAQPVILPDWVRQCLDGPMKDVTEIVFANRQMNDDGHWYANLGYYAKDENRKAYRAKGRLSRLNLRTGELKTILDDPAGTIRDPQVHYDGKTILFSWRKGGSDDFHLCEIQPDGSGLRQITDGPFSDFEPTYLPDGGIVFISNRCNRWVNCWLTQVAIQYRCDGDGKNLRPVSSNSEQENTPWPLPDGRILYQRWEYTDRSQVHYHHLWTMNPDGAGQMIFYGNFNPGTVMIDAKPVPDSEKVVAIFSPGHGIREHDGQITLVSPKKGPDDLGSAIPITKGNHYRDPWAFSEDCFIAASGQRILLINGQGKEHVLYQLPKELTDAGVFCHEPRPLFPRLRERIVAPLSKPEQPTGKLILADVNLGRNMVGVQKGQIKKLLILETLPMPIHYTGGMQPITLSGSFTIERLVGTVPVEPDGSAYFEVPALRSFFFVALDENNESVKRMQSFMTVQPGETLSCVGCHEQRTKTPANPGRGSLLALAREASKIAPVPNVPDVFDFPRDIQPILDRHCIKCHNDRDRKAGIVLNGFRGPLITPSYFWLVARGQIADGRNEPKSSLPPRTIGAVASPLMHKVKSGHNGVKLSPQEIDTLRYWIEAGATYPGTYAALTGGMIGDSDENQQSNQDITWPTTKAGAEVIARRCTGCHTEAVRPLPRALCDNIYGYRHWVFNLDEPQRSLFLQIPLRKDAGGLGLCAGQKDPQGQPQAVFASTDDPDFKILLAMITAGKQRIEQETRFDMPQYKPPRYWVREMKRYGVLDPATPRDAILDARAIESRYWQSLWYNPENR
jgi:hypothetical protein